MQCTVCSSSDLVKLPAVDGYERHHCRTCSHVFVSDPIPSGLLDKAYDHSYYVQAGTTHEYEGYADYLGSLDRRIVGFRRWIAGLASTVGRPGRSLDFGCAVGAMVKAAQDCGWEAIGYERSQWAAEYGRQRLGVNIVTGDGEIDPFAPQSFDLITMWDVVEHLENPREIIGLVSRWLKIGGWLAVNTVDGGSWGARLAKQNWRHLHAPTHLQYFTRRSLRCLLETQGYQITRQRGNGVFLEARRRQQPLGPVAAAVEASLTHWRARGIADLVGLTDEIEVLARRT